MTDIFISYSHRDQEYARNILNELSRFKVRGFMDVTDLAVGAELSQQLRESVKNADAVIAILSNSGSYSTHVMAEIGLAQSFKKEIYPVLAPGSDYQESIPPQLLDELVIDANHLEPNEVAATIVAGMTNTSVESALLEVRTGIRRRQKVLASIAGVLVVMTLLSLSMAFQSYKARIEAENSRTEAEASLENSEENLFRLQAFASLKLDQEKLGSFALSPDGKILATVNYDGDIGLWDLNAARVVARLGQNDESYLSALEFSPDSRLLATGNINGEVDVWLLSESSKLFRFTERSSPVTELKFSHNSRKLFASYTNGTIHQWSLDSGLLVQTIDIDD